VSRIQKQFLFLCEIVSNLTREYRVIVFDQLAIFDLECDENFSHFVKSGLVPLPPLATNFLAVSMAVSRALFFAAFAF
jgi:hypothetical protein